MAISASARPTCCAFTSPLTDQPSQAKPDPSLLPRGAPRYLPHSSRAVVGCGHQQLGRVRPPHRVHMRCTESDRFISRRHATPRHATPRRAAPRHATRSPLPKPADRPERRGISSTQRSARRRTADRCGPSACSPPSQACARPASARRRTACAVLCLRRRQTLLSAPTDSLDQGEARCAEMLAWHGAQCARHYPDGVVCRGRCDSVSIAGVRDAQRRRGMERELALQAALLERL